MIFSQMNYFTNSNGACPIRLRHYEISSDRHTAEIRGRLLRGIRARLRGGALCLFSYDVRDVEKDGASTGSQVVPGDDPGRPGRTPLEFG